MGVFEVGQTRTQFKLACVQRVNHLVIVRSLKIIVIIIERNEERVEVETSGEVRSNWARKIMDTMFGHIVFWW